MSREKAAAVRVPAMPFAALLSVSPTVGARTYTKLTIAPVLNTFPRKPGKSGSL